MKRGVFGVLLILVLGTASRAEDPVPEAPLPPCDFYFSAKDPHLPQTEKALAEAIRTIPTISLHRVPIDDAAGYKAMAKVEQDYAISDPGEMLLIFGPYHLTSKGERRDIETYFLPMMKRLVGQMKGDNSFKGRLPVDEAAYARKIFGEGVTLKEENGGDAIRFLRVYRNGKPSGWVVDAFQPITCPICSDVQFLLAADESTTLIDVRPVRGLERYGRPISDQEQAGFVAQFKGKTGNDAVKVDGISHATKTSMAYQAAIDAILKKLKERK